MTTKQDNPLHAQVDEILAWLLNTTPNRLGIRGRHNGYFLAQSKFIKLIIEQRIDELGRAKPYLLKQAGDYSQYFEERMAQLSQLDKEKHNGM